MTMSFFKKGEDRVIVAQTVVVPPIHSQRRKKDPSLAAAAASIDVVATAVDQDGKKKVLNLMMISCEENPPYGPARDTAVMFLELLCQSYERKQQRFYSQQCRTATADNGITMTISIAIYHAQSSQDCGGDYPRTTTEWSSYDGIIIPGSLSAAYDNTHVVWIEKLQSVIRDTIHVMKLKTLGVCFGHQCFAHAFGKQEFGVEVAAEASTSWNCEEGGEKDCEHEEGGHLLLGRRRRASAIKCPTGAKVGRISCKLTREGQQLLLHPNINDDTDDDSNVNNRSSRRRSDVEMLYTHGDMVYSLPDFAITLGGTTDVPITACAYFSSVEEKNQYLLQQQQERIMKSNLGGDHSDNSTTSIQPYAFTFQAHPEYTSTTGFNINYINTVKAMEHRGSITHQMSSEVCEDALVNFDRVRDDSVDVMIAVAAILGWF